MADYYRDANNHRNSRTLVICSEEPYQIAESKSAEYAADRPDKILQDLEDKESVLLVRTALSSFDPDHALLLYLKYFEGWPDQRIADYLDVPLGTTKTRLRKAKKEFKKEVTKLERRW